MKTKGQILKVLKEELPYLKQRYGASNIGLFGSYSRDEQTEHSDIDLLVDFEKPIDYFNLFEMEDYLKEKFGIDVEIVTRPALKERIKNRILKEVSYVS
ncbi:MAG: nucleotidyltransferase family protein [Candidatus Methanofastidiosum sp.]|nr:nucleotidyltransferase family protein [Methanofastidiosum sp.]NYT13857.1 nucleotidyltransferase family protein [Candidatus Methanofastidiosa archaeon]